MTQSLDHHTALIYTMVTTSAVDQTMTDAELSRIGEIVSHLPVFANYDADGLVARFPGLRGTSRRQEWPRPRP